MKILVLGAGVIGTTTAWYLTQAGHKVVVVDRQSGAGLETSFANGGQISACHAEPWANPSVFAKIWKWHGKPDAPLVFNWKRWDPDLWAWGLHFLRNCTSARAARNTEKVLRLCLYSRDSLKNLRSELGLSYDNNSKGILHIYRDAEEFSHARHAADIMAASGLPRYTKTARECVEIEPALSSLESQLTGGIFSPEDESGDAYLFTRALAEAARKQGAEFLYGVTVTDIERHGRKIAAIVTDQGPLRADLYILCLGSWSPCLGKSLGLSLPIYPAKGYSATLPIQEGDIAPSVSITDDENKLVFTRLGQRLRIAGTAELSGWDNHLNPIRTASLVEKAKQVFPHGGDWSRNELWCGLRPTTPDYAPIIGECGFDNMLLNTGHGTLGWTMACGSAKALAGLICGSPPEIRLEGYEADRFSLIKFGDSSVRYRPDRAAPSNALSARHRYEQ